MITERIIEACQLAYGETMSPITTVYLSWENLSRLILANDPDWTGSYGKIGPFTRFQLGTPQGPVDCKSSDELEIGENQFLMVCEGGYPQVTGYIDTGCISVGGEPLLVIRDPRFLLKRNKHGVLPNKHVRRRLADAKDYGDPEWSERIIDELSKSWANVLVFWDYHNSVVGLGQIPADDLGELLEIMKIDNFEIVHFDSRKQFESVETLKRSTMQYGVTIKVAKNPREVNHLNLDMYLVAPFLTWAGAEDHDQLGIEVDKPNKFLDFANARKSKANW